MHNKVLTHRYSIVFLFVFMMLDTFMPTKAYVASATPIYQTTTITVSGQYAVSQNFTGEITIATSDVMVDLNKHTITSSGDNPAIVINAGQNNIYIFNGIIEGSSGNNVNGIEVNGLANTLCSFIYLNNLCINNFLGAAISLNYSFFSNVTSCELTRNGVGVLQNYCNANIIDSCVAQKNLLAGYQLNACGYTLFKKCKAIATTNTDQDVYGFYSYNYGEYNIFESCYIEGIQSSAGNAYGIYMQTDLNSIIHACVINTVSAHIDAYGIQSPTTPYTCFIFQNLIENVNGLNSGTGLGGNNTNNCNIIIQNRVFKCATNYSSTIVNISSSESAQRLYNISFN